MRRFVDVGHEESRGINYISEVRDDSFPNTQTKGYEMAREEWEMFLEQIRNKEWRGTGMADGIYEHHWQSDIKA